MTESKGAPPPERKSWNKSEWENKAREKDEKNAERAKAADAAMKQGRKPKFHDDDSLPEPTKALERRTEDLQLSKNLNKTMLVTNTTSGKGPRGAGFYCELCDRTLKDSISYLDHLNSRYRKSLSQANAHVDLRHLGQTNQTARSTLSQVRARIAHLRAQTATKVTAQNYDFKKRLMEVKQAEEEDRARRKEERRERRQAKLAASEVSSTVVKKRGREEEGNGTGAEVEEMGMADMMGFGGFGGSKKGRGG